MHSPGRRTLEGLSQIDRNFEVLQCSAGDWHLLTEGIRLFLFMKFGNPVEACKYDAD